MHLSKKSTLAMAFMGLVSLFCANTKVSAGCWCDAVDSAGQEDRVYAGDPASGQSCASLDGTSGRDSDNDIDISYYNCSEGGWPEE